MSTPVRIQLRRAKGWRLPANAVKVDRSTKWGNPFRSDQPTMAVLNTGARTAAEAFRFWLESRPGLADAAPERRKAILDSLHELRGKDLACWCRPGEPCHADVLLELANKELP
jgi:hypothetical protein